MQRMARWSASAAALILASSCSFDASGRPGAGGQDADAPVDADDTELIDADPGGGDIDADAPPPDADDGGLFCTPGESFCDGRTLRTCNEDGTAIDPELDQDCTFTCNDAQCVFASNLPPAVYEACDGSAPPLSPPQGAVFERSGSSSHIVCDSHCGDNSTTQIEAVARESQGGGNEQLAVFCLAEVEIAAGVTIGVSEDDPLADAVAIIVDGDVVIAGEIDMSGGDGGNNASGRRGPGGWNGGGRSSGTGNPGEGSCGGEGGERDDGAAGGGGGGGHHGDGGDGGDGKDEGGSSASGGAGLGGCGNEEISPLVGGYGGGSGASGDCAGGPCGWPGGGGGGAIQISARASIRVASGGAIIARGGDGFGHASGPGSEGGGGGGSGGAILLEAPEVILDDPGALLVEGGAGGASKAGPGGGGATANVADGGEGLDFEGDSESGGGSGGGGGGGRVRISSEGGDAPCSNASPQGGCRTGSLRPSAP